MGTIVNSGFQSFFCVDAFVEQTVACNLRVTCDLWLAVCKRRTWNMICKPYDNHRIWFVIKSWLHFLVASLVKTTWGDHWGSISSLWCGFLGCCWTWVLSVLHGFSTGTTCWMILGSLIGDRLGIPPVYCWMCDCTLRFCVFEAWWLVRANVPVSMKRHWAYSHLCPRHIRTRAQRPPHWPQLVGGFMCHNDPLSHNWVPVMTQQMVCGRVVLKGTLLSPTYLWFQMPENHIFVVSNARECQYFPFKSFQSLLVIFSHI